MRRSLLLRLLVLSLTVASLAVVATAVLATYGTGSQLRSEAESSASLLETDSDIRETLLSYASDHRDWTGVEQLIRQLALRYGRRIALTTPSGEPVVDSAALLGEGSSGLPSTPAARIDAALSVSRPTTGRQPTFTRTLELGSNLAYYGWQLTEREKRRRETIADQAVDCLNRKGVEAELRIAGGRIVLQVAADRESGVTGVGPGSPPQLDDWYRACVPSELSAPSAAARRVNEQAIQLTIACLETRDLDYEVSVDTYGLRMVTAPSGEGESPKWTACARSSREEAIRPYVAGPVDLYLGTSDRFDPFSADGSWRTATTVGIVLLVAAAVTALAGRRLVRPIRALTAAAQRMGAGDRSARVAEHGNDEVTQLAAAFNAMAASIEKTDRQRKSLVSDIAHELRSPLTNVRSHLEAAEDGIVALDGTLLRSLREEASLLSRLVADLEDLALADAGILRVHPEERDAVDLAEQAVAAHRSQAEVAGVAVVLHAPERISVRADPARLRQALGNLVANAITHTPSGGSVRLFVRRDADSVVFTVADTGRGIEKEHLPHVFDRFYRADPARSRSTGGGGLGLAITRHLVEAHGGRVEATSEPGRGSIFTVTLPW
ncbi:signal transduction histidine kinase [Saccharomonospora marina XMU15]|uniref:histidine kinase n=1 Tax=Saccharomonospora marina XMU15 TaxID=882083 RepID=H5WZ90_9PSEU|nr:HAMP domain-containing sensor histidine kinase [Saccharomonospora marina]EHR48491.1 signal transduction histidine kinase [Saccharomonospora marina XMU15]